VKSEDVALVGGENASTMLGPRKRIASKRDKIEALRRLGEMLQATQRAKGGQPYHESSTPSELVGVETLDDLHLDNKTSSIAQKLAELSDEQFEQVSQRAHNLSLV